MTYEQTLDYLFTQLPMYQRAGATAMKKDLTNIRALLEWLGNPHEQLKCVHVAGTNGKGTTCHLLAAALQAHGQTVGMYTSPHYKDFRERIKINAEFISEEAVTDFVERLRASDLSIEPSFFEITVAMAFDYFAKQQPDWCIIEVGLGGRLDSTNVITPVLSVITNIGFDHTQFLGETLPEIAGEKGGIIKPGVPVVIGETQDETTPVFKELARTNRSQIIFADQAYDVYLVGMRGMDNLKYFSIGLPGAEAGLIIGTDLDGPHLSKNMLTAYAALLLLHGNGFEVSGKSVQFGWKQVAELTYYVGRWQILQQRTPFCIADSAHNTEGLVPVIKRLVALEKPLHIVLGVVNDKDLTKALPLFPQDATYYFVKADIPRGLPAEKLRATAAEYGLKGSTYSSVAEGYGQAKLKARSDKDSEGVVFVGGSIFTVAEVL
ncbi:bifunctional folylpolyglutamate synthase/dihydrofolate synthase [Neolewinella aurantiaca]|uniref:Dihydrofolate synthase/folylpolyglutamate synthase n=1 Tax=Neolewinella aurantiaca TaxID=2602767 RepID=A0A5C7FLC6_9BACT|nr:folylpolyglutamate synthase/dihydrofolate synthase family protein [Neolewinella aurantiaca]TXF91507.1 bifunctional folylpolyglutamate synthase/dihydrofolate synthase [Neolewinella aurantiaca]